MATENDMEKLWAQLYELFDRPKSDEVRTDIADTLKAIRTGMVQEMKIANQQQETNKGDEA